SKSNKLKLKINEIDKKSSPKLGSFFCNYKSVFLGGTVFLFSIFDLFDFQIRHQITSTLPLPSLMISGSKLDKSITVEASLSPYPPSMTKSTILLHFS